MAVFTNVTTQELDTLLSDYDIGQAKGLHGIAEGVQNSNFFLTTEQDKFILTLYEQTIDADDLPFFLNLMLYLSQRGIECPLPVLRRDGTLLSTIADRPAAIVTFLKGSGLKSPRSSHCAEAGAGLAKLHLAGHDFPLSRQNNLGHAYWQSFYSPNAARANEVMPSLATEIEHELERIAKHWPSDLPSGIIHADLFPDNTFFLDDKLSGIIDFYFACNDFYAYDLAICLNAWCFEADMTFNLTKARAMINSYHKVRPLSENELEHLPLLCAGASMRFLLTRLHDWLNRVDGALVNTKDPVQYLRRLRFHKNARSAADYGVDI